MCQGQIRIKVRVAQLSLPTSAPATAIPLHLRPSLPPQFPHRPRHQSGLLLLLGSMAFDRTRQMVGFGAEDAQEEKERHTGVGWGGREVAVATGEVGQVRKEGGGEGTLRRQRSLRAFGLLPGARPCSASQSSPNQESSLEIKTGPPPLTPANLELELYLFLEVSYVRGWLKVHVRMSPSPSDHSTLARRRCCPGSRT